MVEIEDADGSRAVKKPFIISFQAIIIGGFIFTFFVSCLTAIITLQVVLISRQNNMERLVMMVMASQSPSAELETLLNKYFLGDVNSDKMGIDNKSMQPKQRRVTK